MDNTENTQLTKEGQSASPIPYILPFAAYMLIASRVDVQPDSIDDVSVSNYIWLVAAQVIVTAGLVIWFFRQYQKSFPITVDFWGLVVGIVGFFLWVGICGLNIEAGVLGSIGLAEWLPERAGFNPWSQISNESTRSIFLVLRFTMLALLVPLIEELFLRGWLIRFFVDPDWNTVSLSNVGRVGWLTTVVYAAATHPGELIAAIVWFGLITCMMIRTGKFWNCFVAHAITNMLLGIYVIFYGRWELW